MDRSSWRDISLDRAPDFVDVRVYEPDENAGRCAVEAVRGGYALCDWLPSHMNEVKRLLDLYGAVLLKGFTGQERAEDLNTLLKSVGMSPLEYLERSTPRSRLDGKVYSSTEFPAEKEIKLHSELSAALNPPRYLWFQCVKAASTGGETPTADARRVLASLSSTTVAAFRSLGWKLTRVYGTGFGPDWREAFQTEDRVEVESYCRANDIAYAWDADRLRTTQVRSAIVAHPSTGEECWFNHVAFWHPSAYDPDVYTAISSAFGPDGFPFQVEYGDGSNIDSDVASEIREAYALNKVSYPWHNGEVLVVDNILSCHGRNPYTGSRKIAVAMTEVHHRGSWLEDTVDR